MDIFNKAVRNLTIKYLAVLMILSLFFSFVLYQVSSRELGAQLMRQQQNYISPGRTRLLESIESLRLSQLEEGRTRLKTELVLFNLVVLVTGLAASYLLAKSTLEPIEDMMRAQNRFTADASHELRTPLTVMRTEIEVALRSKSLPAAEAREVLASNLEEVKRLQDLSTSLLALARLPDSHSAQHMTQLDIQSVLQSVTKHVSALATQKNIRIKLAKAEPIMVTGDADSLERLFVILLDNAIKYSQSDTDVKIETHTKNSMVTIDVKDTGIGVSETDLPHIFERFYRADTARTAGGLHGYGLGLSIAQNIVEIHKGTISVDSEQGKGSTFTVSLPRIKTSRT